MRELEKVGEPSSVKNIKFLKLKKLNYE